MCHLDMCTHTHTHTHAHTHWADKEINDKLSLSGHTKHTLACISMSVRELCVYHRYVYEQEKKKRKKRKKLPLFVEFGHDGSLSAQPLP